MQKKNLRIEWKGIFLEICTGRISPDQRDRIDALGSRFTHDAEPAWYNNTELLATAFNVESWWAIDDLDHTMGLVFNDRATLDRKMTSIAFSIDADRVTVDPDALQLSIYAPEALPALSNDETVLVHGARREATLHLDAEFEPPFDPSMITLSLMRHPEAGLVLIDLDYDGYDDIRFTWGKTSYLVPRFIGKDAFDDIAG